MASTNHTTNYSLSQFVGSDKPAWLGDYNQDMDKIDTQMKVNADAISTLGTTVSGHTTAISGLTSDMSTAQSDISGLDTRMTAVETKNGEQDTAITNAQNKADTADGKADTNAQNISAQGLEITNLQSDVSGHTTAIANNASNITTVANNLTAFESSMKIDNFSTATSLTTHVSQVSLTLAQSDDSAIFKIYGRLRFNDNESGGAYTYTKTAVPGLTGNYGFKTSLQLTNAPDEAYAIADAMLVNSKYETGFSDIASAAIAVGTDGYIYLWVNTSNTITVNAYNSRQCWLAPCVYFNTNFGDEPEANA